MPTFHLLNTEQVEFPTSCEGKRSLIVLSCDTFSRLCLYVLFLYAYVALCCIGCRSALPLFTFCQARLSGKAPGPVRSVWIPQFNGCLLSNIVYSVCDEYESHRHQKAGSYFLGEAPQVARGVLVLHWEAIQITVRVRGCVDCCGPSGVCLDTWVDLDSLCPIAPVLRSVNV